MQVLAMEEANLVSGGDAIADFAGGVIGVGGGISAVGGGMAVESAAIGGVIIGGGVIAIAGGLALIGYGVYEALH